MKTGENERKTELCGFKLKKYKKVLDKYYSM